MEDVLRDRMRSAYFPRDENAGRRLADSGAACSVIAETIGDRDRAEQVLATLFWWCYVRTPLFEGAISRYITQGKRRVRREDLQIIVVAHGDDARRDLLVLGPPGTESVAFYAADESYSPRTRRTGGDIRSVTAAESERLQRRLMLAGIDVDRRVVSRAVSEMWDIWPFSIVTGTQPGMSPTGARTPKLLIAPCPALPVTVHGTVKAAATAGVIGTDNTGRVLVVTARHAVLGAGEVHVAGWPAKIRASDEVTDTCLLEVSCPADAWPGAGLAGPRKIAPVEHRPGTFDGAGSQHRQTMIRAYDLSILDPDQYLASKVYTDPDTVPGDSGAALIDSEDYIVGFAVSRTAFGAPYEFSSWVWADQVLARYGLT